MNDRRPDLFRTIGILVAITAAPALAHHSFSGQFDRDTPVSFEGVVTKMEWQNPHVWFYFNEAR